jgi:hypothetical protein
VPSGESSLDGCSPCGSPASLTVVSAYTPYVDRSDRILPTAVRALRVLLYVGGVITLLTTFGYLASEGLTGATVGQAVWSAWPGVAGLVIARKVHLGGRRRFWVIVVVAAFWILGALGAIGRGDPRGVTELILPIALLVALTRRSSRDYFLR